MIGGEIFPHYTSDEDWQRMARRRFVGNPEGGLRPDYDLNIFKPFFGSVAAANLWPFFDSLQRIPALAIRGQTSDLLTPEVFAQMKPVVPHMRQATVPNRGHVPLLDEPEALKGIDDFLCDLPVNPGPLTIVRRQLAVAWFMTRLKIQGIA